MHGQQNIKTSLSVSLNQLPQIFHILISLSVWLAVRHTLLL